MSDYIGLFGVTSYGSVIRNLGLADVNIKGSNSVGGLVGTSDSTISNIYVTGSITGMGERTGGLVGLNQGSISNVYTSVLVTGAGMVGGLAGYNNHGSISNTYASGIVSSAGAVGGVVGGGSTGSVLNSFYATTDASGASINAGLASNSDGGIGKTWQELTQASTFAGWNIASNGGSNATWRIYEGFAGPVLRSFLQRVSLITAGGSSTKTYNGSTAAGAASYTSNLGSDLNAGKLLGSLGYVTSSKNVGTYSTGNGSLTVNGLYSGQQGYDIGYRNLAASVTVNKAMIGTITGLSVADRAYNGTTTATLNSSNAVFSGMVAGDSLSIGSANASFTNKNVGTAKTVNITGITVSGADAGNYNVGTTAVVLANITKAIITVTGITAQDRTYDGTTNASLNTGNVTFTGLIGTERVDVSSATGTFDSKDAGDGKTVNISNIVLGGSQSSNYTLASTTATASANIAKASISAVTGITAQDRTYDGTADASLDTGNAAFTGRFGNDQLSVAAASGTFADKNAGDGKTVSIGNIVLGGADAGNYNLVSTTATTSADIAKATISGVTGITAQNRIYDGTSDAGLNTGNAAFTGRLGSDELSVSSANGAFADKNAGDGKTVNIGNIVLGGADAGNYSLASTTATTSADIAKATISGVTGITAQNRTYDGTTDAGLNTGNAAFTGRFGSDELSVTSVSGAFADKNAGDGKTVNIGNIVLGGADAGNYTLASATATTSADIAKATISGVTGITAQNRTYDGTTDAGLNTGNAAFTGRLGSDELGVTSASGAFADKNAGNGKTVSIGNIVLGGADAGNYTLADNTATSSADIARATISGVTGITAQNRTYDGTTDAGLNTGNAAFTGRIGSDELSVTSASGAFADKNAGDGKTVNIGNIVLGGADAGNYTLAENTAGTTADIAKASISAVTGITAQNRTYDGTTDAGLNTGNAAFTGRIGSDELSVTSASGAFADKNAGNGKTVAISGIVLGGADAGNYTLLDTTAAGSADIAKASISGVTGITAQDRTYDGTTDADLNTGNAAFTGRFGNDELSVTSASGAFADKNAGNGKTVAISAIVLGGADAGNYTLLDTTAASSADIAKASISGVTGITAQDRTYDGTTDASLNTASAGFSGRFGNDELRVTSASGAFADRNAGEGKSVAVSAITLGGADAGNYVLARDTSSTQANITKAALTITADDASKVAGQSISLNGYTTRGLVAGDSVASVSLASNGEPTSAAAGTYAIVASDATGADLGNYAIQYQEGALLVTPAPSEPGQPGQPSQPVTGQPYLGALVSNNQSVSNEAGQQAGEPDGLGHEALITNPSDERLNLHVINQGIRLPEGI